MNEQQLLQPDEETVQKTGLTYEKLITETLNRYKRKQASNSLVLLPILNGDEVTIGFLHPITSDFKTTIVDCVKLLNRWRVENPTLSPSRFPISHERTERWLTDAVIQNDQRILFLVQDLSGHYIGHMGFTSICAKTNSAEIDLVVRGVKDVTPGLMRHAMDALVRWGKQELHLKHIAVMVLWDNEKGIAFYRGCGFKWEETLPLQKLEFENEVRWVPSKNVSRKAEKYYFHMRLI